MLYAHECICEFKLCAYNGWISSGFSAWSHLYEITIWLSKV